MKIYSWNVNGIRAVHKKGALDRFLEEHDPDILCLQETKANHDQTDIDLPQFEEYWCSAEKKGYSGTAIFTKVEPAADSCGMPTHILDAHDLTDTYGDATNEGRVTAIEFEAFHVVSVYTPNAKDDLTRLPLRQRWDAAFLAYVTELNAEKPVVFAGDLNVAHTEDDLARPKDNRGNKGFTDEERAGISAYLDAGFADSFRCFTEGNGHYTWWSHFANARERNVGWRIDYVMIAEALKPLLKSARIHAEIMGSDHCPVSIDIAV